MVKGAFFLLVFKPSLAIFPVNNLSGLSLDEYSQLKAAVSAQQQCSIVFIVGVLAA